MICDWKFTACSVALLLCLTGCGRVGGPMAISGTVLLDGNPVQRGTINFFPADGKGPTAAGIITEGKYSTEVTPGQKEVRIEAFKVLGQRRHIPNNPKSPMVDIREQILPERYNTRTELTCQIAPAESTYDFELKQ